MSCHIFEGERRMEPRSYPLPHRGVFMYVPIATQSFIELDDEIKPICLKYIWVSFKYQNSYRDISLKKVLVICKVLSFVRYRHHALISGETLASLTLTPTLLRTSQ